MYYENEKTEYKLRFSDDVLKEVVAFANTSGGAVYIGVDNEGNKVGAGDYDEEYLKITNAIRDSILPDVTVFVKYEACENGVIAVHVAEGSNKPYYIRSKGLRPGGVYVRHGASSVPASHEAIRTMIKESDGDSFEEMRSTDQELTFEFATEAFKRYGTEFGPEKFRTLGITKDGMFTNLGLLLSDSCRHTTKVAVFADEERTVFRDSREFGGSILRQFEDAAAYLALCNRTGSVISGLTRTDTRDYPEETVREALLNALVHRDYSFSGSIIINITETKAEFISLGGLVPGLTKEDVMMGISQPRNKNLAEVFHRLRLIESYGTGIRRVFKLYEGFPVQPSIEVSAGAFKMVLPNMNAEPPADNAPTREVTGQMKKVLSYLDEYGTISDSEVESLLDVKRTRAYLLMREMSEMGLICCEGRGKDKKYQYQAG
ncbi:MAG: putative DNA binding domain-containing protein [Clostridia bacterium]|nr:putative DNA binding domain-containing protein [Clostridia bacterium]